MEKSIKKLKDKLFYILLDVSELQIDIETAEKKIIKLFKKNKSK